MNKIKVMFFLPNLYGGGAERVTVNIIRQLDNEVFDITLVLLKKVGQFLDLIPLDIKLIELKPNKVLLSIFDLRKCINELKPDVIYATSFRSHIAMDFALSLIKDKPKLIYRSPNSPKLLFENGKTNIIESFFIKRAFHNANIIIAQTPEMKKEIEEFYSVKREKIVVILNPIDTLLIDEKIKNIKNPFEKKYINIVAAGRLVEQKGFDILIKSFEKVVSKNSFFRLYIIGDGIVGEKLKLNNLIKKLKIEQNVYFLGFQSNPYQYFSYADLYVLSSRWEGLPNTVLENLYLKKPIVATKCIPFMSELIEDKENGLLVDVNDIDALSDAILNYKTINIDYTTIKFNVNNIEKLFMKVFENN